MDNNTVVDVKSRLNVVDLIGEYVRLSKAGSSFKGLCPFHNEKTPSFVVSEERQSWHCFGCQKGGDIFTFLMEAEGVGFREALKILADRAGVDLPNYNPQAEKRIRSAYEVLESATRWYEGSLHSEQSVLARRYLKDRGISEESIQAFRLGYAPEGWNHISDHLRSLGYTESDISPTGLLVQKTQESQRTKQSREGMEHVKSPVTTHEASKVSHGYDRFRDRIMFPISDILGRIVGYSARVMPGADEKQGKYINTPETTLYHKSRVLYGISQAKQAIKKEDYVIVVEGNMDVIAMWQSGFANTVAVSGTAMTTEHIRILSRYTKKAILFFDADRAGREAAYKSTIACLQGEMDVFLMNPKGGKDAAELAQSHPDVLRASVQGAQSAMEFFVEHILEGVDVSKAEGKKEVVEKLLPLLRALVNEVEQSDWIRRISERLEVEMSAVVALLSRYTQRETTPTRFSTDRSGEGSPVLEKSRAEVLRKAIIGRMLVNSTVWKNVMDYAEKEADQEVREVLQQTGLMETLFSLGESVEYEFDQFRLLVTDDEIIREAQSIVSGLGEFDIGEYGDMEKWEEVLKLLQSLEKEVWKQILNDLVKEMRSADKAGENDRRESLARRFGEVSQKIQSL